MSGDEKLEAIRYLYKRKDVALDFYIYQFGGIDNLFAYFAHHEYLKKKQEFLPRYSRDKRGRFTTNNK